MDFNLKGIIQSIVVNSFFFSQSSKVIQFHDIDAITLY